MSRLDVNRSGEMEVFVRVVELGGFSAAARALRMTPSAVSKLVARLEARLGARLVNRSTRRIELKAEGSAFYGRAGLPGTPRHTAGARRPGRAQLPAAGLCARHRRMADAGKRLAHHGGAHRQCHDKQWRRVAADRGWRAGPGEAGGVPGTRRHR